MIKEFVEAWNANKDKLFVHFSTHEQIDYDSYEKLVKLLFEIVVNPYLEEHYNSGYNIDRLHEINDGDYQGTLLYLLPTDEYQPPACHYVATFVEYGSCSGCDTLLGISNYDEGMPSEEQVKGYMTLCLNILQHCKHPFNFEEV